MLLTFVEHKRKVVATIIMVLAVASPYVIFLVAQHQKKTTTHAAAVCTVSPVLVNSCRPWLGGEVSNYGGIAGDTKSQVLGHEVRIGRQLDMVHTYHKPGTNSLNQSDYYFINRGNTILEADWIPAPATNLTFNFAGSASNNANIDSMAASIKLAAPKKIIFSLWHEPEDNADTGMAPCTPSGKGHAGSPADFAAMYRYIHDRFVADGVTNVVWGMNFMGAANWDKCFNQFWPGNSYVDWIFWDPYNGANFDGVVGRFYNLLVANTDAAHAYTSKTWGIAEWNVFWIGKTRQDQIDLYNSARTSIDANRWPRLKTFEVFDSLDFSVAAYPGSNKTSNPPVIDAGVLSAYKNFALSPHFTDAFYASAGGGGGGGGTSGDTTAPNVSISQPTNGAQVSGRVTISATASDNVGVARVVFAVDGKTLATPTAAPFTASVDTTTLVNGGHTVTATAFDAANNQKAQQVTVTVQNGPVTQPPDTTAPTVAISSPTASATISGTIIVSATASDSVGVAKVIIAVDGTTVGSPLMAAPYNIQLNSSLYANGTHIIKATAYDAAGNNKVAQVNVTVSNALPPPAPTVLSFTATPSSVTTGSTSRLSWTSLNAINCSISPGGPQKSTLTSWTTAAYTIVGSQKYTLTCYNASSQTATSSVTVNVAAAPQAPATPLFTSNKGVISAGSDVLLSWSSVGATGCVLTPGTFTSSGAAGSRLVTSIQRTITYTISCSNAAGKTSATLQIVVAATPPPTTPAILSFTSTPDTVSAGGTTTLRWTTSNVATNGCALNPSPLTSASANGEWQSPPLTSSISYTLSCKDANAAVVSSSVGVTVNGVAPPPAPSGGSTGAASVSTPIVKALGGQSVVNAQANGTIAQGQLVTLDPTNILDENKAIQIVRVEYYNGEKLIQTVEVPPYALDTKVLPSGSYTLTERTYYGDGSTSERTQDITIKAAAAVIPKKSFAVVPLIVIGLIVTVGSIAVIAVRKIQQSRAMTRQPVSSVLYSDEVMVTPSPTDVDNRGGPPSSPFAQ